MQNMLTVPKIWPFNLFDEFELYAHAGTDIQKVHLHINKHNTIEHKNHTDENGGTNIRDPAIGCKNIEK